MRSEAPFGAALAVLSSYENGKGGHAQLLARWVVRWLETRNPTFMDVALIYCDFHDLPITAPLRTQLVEAAKRRTPPARAAGLREAIKDNAFHLIGLMVCAGLTLREATGKAAVWTNGTWHPLKASTLERLYAKEWRTPQVAGDRGSTREAMLRAEWPNLFEDSQWESNWRAYAEALALPDDHDWGERR